MGNDKVVTASLEVGSKMSLVWETVRVFLALVLLIPLTYFFTRIYGMRIASRHQGLIRVLDRFPIGANKSLLLVVVKGRVFLLSAGDKEVIKLAEWEDDGSLSMQEAPETASGFPAVLKRALQKGGKR